MVVLANAVYSFSKSNGMRKTLFFLLFCLFLLKLEAQKAVFSLHSGISNPLFTYSSSVLGESCFTQPGLFVSAEGAYFPDKRWGWNIGSGLQWHPVEVGVLGWEKVKADPFLQDLYIRSDPYRIIHLVTGPAFRMDLPWHLKLGLNVVGGVFFSQTPYQLYKPVYFMIGPDYYEVTPSKDLSFAWGGGAELQYAVTPYYDLSFVLNFMHSDAAFGFNTANGLRIDKRSISMLNAGVGVVFHLF